MVFDLEKMPMRQLSKAPEKLHLYPAWRDKLEGLVSASGIGARRARQVLNEMRNATDAELQACPDDDDMVNLDVVS